MILRTAARLVVGLVLAALAICGAGAACAQNEAGRPFYLVVSGPNQPPVRLYLEEMGHGRPIVLLHGLGGSSYGWRRIAPELARFGRVIAIDLRGFGRSDKPLDLAYAPTAQAELVNDALAQLGLEDVVLVGHSFGGVVALTAAVQEHVAAQSGGKRRIGRLALLSTPAFPQKLTTMIELLRAPILPYLTMMIVPPRLPVMLSFMSEAVGMGDLTSADIDIYAEPMHEAGARHAIIETARQLIPPNAPAIIARYGELEQRALLIWCRNDRVVPLTSGERLLHTLQHAKLAMLDGCDHAVQEQVPEAITALLSDFLRK